MSFLGLALRRCRRDLLSHRVAPAVPLACVRFTTEFGMGSGGTTAPSSPAKVSVTRGHGRGLQGMDGGKQRGRGTIVCECQIEAKRAIRTRTLNVLPRLHAVPINRVIFPDPSGRAHLEGGFPLRCFQRLSRPHVATRQCRWRDNRNTRGASIPVLSY